MTADTDVNIPRWTGYRLFFFVKNSGLKELKGTWRRGLDMNNALSFTSVSACGDRLYVVPARNQYLTQSPSPDFHTES